MIFLILFLICVFICSGVGVLAGIADIRRLMIPNMYSVYIAASFVAAYIFVFLSGNMMVFKSVQSHVLSAVIMFGVTFFMFGLKMIGAGDSKFATACALWISVRDLPVFIFYMTIVGAVLGIASIYIRKKKPFENPREGSWVAQVQGGASKVPYGVAIASGMIIAFMYAGYFSPDVLSYFVTTIVSSEAS